MGLRTAIVAAALLAPAVLAQSVWQQCGGVQYTGGKNCEAGTHCVFVNDYYSQCQPGAPAGVTTSSIKTTSTTSTTSSKSTTSTTSPTSSKPTSTSTATKTTTTTTGGSGPITTTTTTPAGPVGTGFTASGNPFIGYSAYANPYYSSEIYTNAIPTLVAAGKSALAAKASQVAQIGTYVWLDTMSKVPTLEPYLTDIRAKNAAGANPKLFAPFVVYDLPDRDCAAKASNGEYNVANDGVAKYKAYVDAIYNTLIKFTDVNTILIIEPDSLANMATNMNVAKCTAAAPYYKELTAYTIKKLNLPHVTMYLDGGHAGWLGWPANLAPAAKIFGDVYKNAGSPRAVRGLVTNVSNYNAYQATTCAPITSVLAGINGVCDEKGYVNALAPFLTAEGFPAHFITDIGRSGKQPTGQIEWGHWCNAKSAGFGLKPTHSTNDPLVDSLVWVKPGGESDGTSDSSATRYDSFCGSASSFTPAPEAGQWFQAYFEMLLTNAAF